MLLNWDLLVEQYGLADKVTGIVHCGAHLCEEAPSYNDLSAPVWWIEANPNLRAEIETALAPYPDQHLIEALLADVDDQDMTLHISGPDYRGSSSVLDWGTHRTFSPLDWVDHVKGISRTLDSLWAEHGFAGANMLVTDLQGMDGAALRGAGRFLEQVDFVMCEVNATQVYVGCMEIDEVDALLAAVAPVPFQRVETYWVGDQGWGDGFYSREGQA